MPVNCPNILLKSIQINHPSKSSIINLLNNEIKAYFPFSKLSIVLSTTVTVKPLSTRPECAQHTAIAIEK